MNKREYDQFFDDVFADFTRGREDHEFVHYNNAMGIEIKGKAHYKYEMKRRGMLPMDAAERLAEEWDRKHPRQEYGDLTPRAQEVVSSLRMTADKHGNIKLGGRAIQALKEIGAIKAPSEHLPKELITQGGFNA